MWVIEQALGQDDWILSKFFFCVFMDRGKVEVYILAKNIQLSLRDKVGQQRIYCMTFGEFFMRDTSGSPEWARWFHLACLGSQSQRSIWVIFSARGDSHIMSNGNKTEWRPIQSVFIRVITKSDDRAAGVRFVYHEYDYRLNWTTRSPIIN